MTIDLHPTTAIIDSPLPTGHLRNKYDLSSFDLRIIYIIKLRNLLIIIHHPTTAIIDSPLPTGHLRTNYNLISFDLKIFCLLFESQSYSFCNILVV